MRALRQIDNAMGEVLQSIEMLAGFGPSGLEGDSKETFYCGGGNSWQVRAVKRSS